MNSLSAQHVKTILGRQRPPLSLQVSLEARTEPSLVDQVATVRARIGKIEKACPGRWAALQCLVAEATHWPDHPQGPARARGFKDRLETGPHGWEVAFGANKFLVEHALDACLAYLDVALQRAESDERRLRWSEVQPVLAQLVAGSVANLRGEIYSTYPTDDAGNMHFGVHAISIRDFVDCLHDRLELHRVFSA